ncbi:MAG: MFS transporter [Proteobacteria bacterium]|nr:MFS transporter [Pseudomonadota bacterium]
MTISRDYKNVGILAACQALFMSGLSMQIILSGLVGAAIAEDKALATLPISAVVIASTLSTIPASLLMKRIGRRAGFIVGNLFGLVGASIASYALYNSSFGLFCFGMFVFGVNAGFSSYFRFAAADVAPVHFKSRAISWVISGGIAAALLGPELAKRSHDLVDGTPFLGSYAAMAGLTIIGMVLLTFLDIPLPNEEERLQSGRPLATIALQPALIVAVLVGMIGYGTMNLLMTATPLAMVGHGFHIGDATFVIQWHMVAMFAPAFFTGILIQRIGVVRVLLGGTVMLGAAVAFALSGTGIIHYWLALFALGLGWNFTYVGASTLLTETYAPAERGKVQALNDFMVFGTVALASLTSGTILYFLNWNAVNLAAIGPIGVALIAALWLRLKRRAEQTA